MNRQQQSVLKWPQDFEIVEDYAVIRPVGQVTLEQAAQVVEDAIIFSREQKIKKLLVNITGLFGFGSPSISARYFFIHDWARAAEGQICIAFVARPEIFDFEKIGTLVAKNKGVSSGAFESEQKALEWLRSMPG